MFHIAFVLDRITDIGEVFIPNEPMQPVTFGDAFCDSDAMFPNAASKIVRYADVKRSVWFIGDDLDPSPARA